MLFCFSKFIISTKISSLAPEEKSYTENELLEKLARYCTYQERCVSEVRKKLDDLKATPEQIDNIVNWLSSERFINEERYAKVIAGSKFRLKKWGKFKIIQFLKAKQIPSSLIYAALNESIEADSYISTLEYLAHKKHTSLGHKKDNLTKQKLVRHLLSKGYENDLIWEVVPPLFE